jgi:RHS repeat-associated protein
MDDRRELFWACFRAGDPLNIPIDPNGNLATKTEGSDSWVYTWNAENQLTKVEKNGAEVARFAYDPLGRRAEKVAGGVTASYAYDGGDILREVRGGSTFKYVHGPGSDQPLAVDDAGTLSYFHADGLGSIVRTTNAAGSVGVARQYDAWGNLEVGATQSGYAFTGREWDPEIELYYYRARYYDPTLGRFGSEDLPTVDGGGRRYVYVRNNPAVYRDPSGWWESRGLGPDPNKVGPYTGCGGDGYPEPVMPTKGPPCLRRCAEYHERSHVVDIMMAAPGICFGKPARTVIRGSEQEERASERGACETQLRCLRGLLERKRSCPDPQCTVRQIQDAITSVEIYCQQFS